MKKLWSKAIFRWLVYQAPLILIGLSGVENRYKSPIGSQSLEEGWWLIWILILASPAMWVWRKPLMRLGSFLNHSADGDD